ncbi:hypothetical protein U1Q18_031280, partial [Sarracenia purpurea var. burkii]
MFSPNRFSVLQSLESEDVPKIIKAPNPRGPRSCTSIIAEAVCIHGNLKEILRDNSMGANLSELLRAEKKALESDFKSFRSCPDSLIPEILTAIEARILKIKGVLPVKGEISTEDSGGSSEHLVTPNIHERKVDEAGSRFVGHEATEREGGKADLGQEFSEGVVYDQFPLVLPSPNDGIANDDKNLEVVSSEKDVVKVDSKPVQESLEADESGQSEDEQGSHESLLIPLVSLHGTNPIVNFDDNPIAVNIVDDLYSINKGGIRRKRVGENGILTGSAPKVLDEMTKSNFGKNKLVMFHGKDSVKSKLGSGRSKLKGVGDDLESAPFSTPGEEEINIVSGRHCLPGFDPFCKDGVRVQQVGEAEFSTEPNLEVSEEMPQRMNGDLKSLAGECMKQAGGSGPGFQTGCKLEEHKASVQPIGASSWASIVASKGDPKQLSPRLNHRSPVGKLEYVEPKELGIIDIDENLVDEEFWENSLVGYFFNAQLPFGLIRATAMNLWRHEGLSDVYGNDQGFFFFKFNSAKSMERILEIGLWHFS